MDTITAIETRRSVKHYDPEHRMTKEEVDRLMSLAVKSPTSFNIQNWRFVVVQDSELRQRLCEAAWGQTQVTDASLLVILCADLMSWGKEPSRYWKDAPKETWERLGPLIEKFYKDNEALQRDEAMRSVGIAAQTLMLSAKAMGYDSCPMIGFDPGAVGELINLPGDHVIGMMVTIGKAAKPAQPRNGQLPLSEVVIRDRF